MLPSDRGKFAITIAKGYGGEKKEGDGDDSDASKEEPESDDDAAREAAGEELAAALKSGDGKEIYRAFESLKELCEGS